MMGRDGRDEGTGTVRPDMSVSPPPVPRRPYPDPAGTEGDRRRTARRATLVAMGTLTFRVEGMHCRHRVRDVTALIRDVPGVETVTADARTGLVTVAGAASVTEVLDVLRRHHRAEVATPRLARDDR